MPSSALQHGRHLGPSSAGGAAGNAALASDCGSGTGPVLSPAAGSTFRGTCHPGSAPGGSRCRCLPNREARTRAIRSGNQRERGFRRADRCLRRCDRARRRLAALQLLPRGNAARRKASAVPRRARGGADARVRARSRGLERDAAAGQRLSPPPHSRAGPQRSLPGRPGVQAQALLLRRARLPSRIERRDLGLALQGAARSRAARRGFCRQGPCRRARRGCAPDGGRRRPGGCEAPARTAIRR